MTNIDMLTMLYITNNKHTNDVWDEFENIFDSNRFFVNESNNLFSTFIADIMNEPFIIEKDSVYYRGRINKNNNVCFEDKDLRAPDKENATAGRLNPMGISYLYISEDENTVISELRPWIGAYVTIAKCTLRKELKLINFVPKDNEIDKINSFRVIASQRLSKPMQPYSTILEYQPTQCIAEYIKNSGFDGIRYASSTHLSGVNYCIFDVNCMEIKIAKKVEINKIDYFHKPS